MESRSRTDLCGSEEFDDFESIAARFTSLEQVSDAIRQAGVDKCGLIFGIDYTMSNRMQGKRTCNGLSLHDLSQPNPYQQVICILGETLEHFGDKGLIPAYGFGDANTKDKAVFPLKAENNGMCEGFADVYNTYCDVTSVVKLGGPTNFAPLIYKAIEVVKRTNMYHILVITADGQVTSEDETTAAIVAATNYPLSIVQVGVGDGPWEVVREFADKLPTRKFDNFQFVNFHEIMETARNPQAAFALAALMKIPDQYRSMQEMGILPSARAASARKGLGNWTGEHLKQGDPKLEEANKKEETKRRGEKKVDSRRSEERMDSEEKTAKEKRLEEKRMEARKLEETRSEERRLEIRQTEERRFEERKSLDRRQETEEASYNAGGADVNRYGERQSEDRRGEVRMVDQERRTVTRDPECVTNPRNAKGSRPSQTGPGTYRGQTKY